MTASQLVVFPAEIARSLKLPQPLGEDDRYTLEEASQGAQSDVERYLGRPVLPRTYTQQHCWLTGNGWDHLDQYPVISITSYTPEVYPGTSQPTGRFTVVYVAGLDARDDEDLFAIKRYIKVHAMMDPSVQILFRTLRGDIATRVTSASVQGQSATFTDAYPAASSAGRSSPAAVTAQLSMPGSLPTLQTLDEWKISKRRVFQRPTRLGDTAPWPHDLPVDPGLYGRQWVTWW